MEQPNINQTANEEAFREFHADHLRRQTSAIESIRNYVFYLLLIVLIGLAVGLIMGIGASTGL